MRMVATARLRFSLLMRTDVPSVKPFTVSNNGAAQIIQTLYKRQVRGLLTCWCGRTLKEVRRTI